MASICARYFEIVIQRPGPLYDREKETMEKRAVQQGDRFVIWYATGGLGPMTLDFIQGDLWYFTDKEANKRGVINVQSSAIEWIELLDREEQC